MRVRSLAVVLALTGFCASSAVLGADQAPWAGAADEGGRPADPNAGSRGAPAPTRAVPPVAAQPSSSERAPPVSRTAHRNRSAASGATAADRPERAGAAAATESAPSSQGATAASAASEDHRGWRDHDWGWLGLLGLFGLLGLVGRRRREREYYADEVTTEEARDTRVYEPSPRASRP